MLFKDAWFGSENTASCWSTVQFIAYQHPHETMSEPGNEFSLSSQTNKTWLSMSACPRQ